MDLARNVSECSDTFIPSSPMGVLFAAGKESSSLDICEMFIGRPYAATQATDSEGLWSFCRQGCARRAQRSRHCCHECGWKCTKCQIRQYPPPGIHPPPNMRVPKDSASCVSLAASERLECTVGQRLGEAKGRYASNLPCYRTSAACLCPPQVITSSKHLLEAKVHSFKLFVFCPAGYRGFKWV